MGLDLVYIQMRSNCLSTGLIKFDDSKQIDSENYCKLFDLNNVSAKG